MSGHLSTEEKALFKAEIDAIRKEDIFFFFIFKKSQGNHSVYGG
jgi:hypothetical protein